MRALVRWDRPRARMVAETCGEIVLAVATATVVVALLQSASPAAGLGVVYLPAVLEVAVRRGQWAGLAAAVLGVLTLNYLFIAPRHQLAIRHTQDLIALIVFLMAAVVVGRLAELGRARAREAESRARLAAAREQEAALLAEAASAILAGHSGQAQFTAIEKLVQTATGAGAGADRRRTGALAPGRGADAAAARPAAHLALPDRRRHLGRRAAGADRRAAGHAARYRCRARARRRARG